VVKLAVRSLVDVVKLAVRSLVDVVKLAVRSLEGVAKLRVAKLAVKPAAARAPSQADVILRAPRLWVFVEVVRQG
jgi:hypothetical protein